MNSTNQKSRQIELLPFHIIKEASEGDASAVNAVLQYYKSYIVRLSTRKMFDEYGQTHYCVDETLYRRLEMKLLTKILDFKIAQ